MNDTTIELIKWTVVTTVGLIIRAIEKKRDRIKRERRINENGYRR